MLTVSVLLDNFRVNSLSSIERSWIILLAISPNFFCLINYSHKFMSSLVPRVSRGTSYGPSNLDMTQTAGEQHASY
jgi:hypothetical protein